MCFCDLVSPLNCRVGTAFLTPRFRDFAAHVDEVLTRFGKAQVEVAVVKVDLHVLTSFLELSYRHFLPFVELCRICVACPRLAVPRFDIGTLWRRLALHSHAL